MSSLLRSSLAAAAVAVLATGLFGAPAWGDAVYHSQHIALQPVGSAPLRSGFVENIHANGPTVYAMERYALVGATPGSYAVTLHLFADTSCTSVIGPFPSITFATNAVGNGVGHLQLSMPSKSENALSASAWKQGRSPFKKLAEHEANLSPLLNEIGRASCRERVSSKV